MHHHIKLIKTGFYFIFFTSLIASCTDVIDVETDPAPQAIVVDAWLNDQSEDQKIRLTWSQTYFDNSFAEGVAGAIITVENSDGNKFEFMDQGSGNYTWTPTKDGELGSIGTTYTLTIEWNNEIYTASSQMNRVPIIDSITQEFRVDDLSGPDGIYTEFFARDFSGRGDTYWIKTFKNGEFLNKPVELNIAYDAGFDPGSSVDGLIFIPPLREVTNRAPDPDTADDSDVPPWAPGDQIRVEIHSITNEVFTFMDIARDQMNNGLNGIFAIPLANARGNILINSSGEKGLGVFCVSAVTSLEKMIE